MIEKPILTTLDFIQEDADAACFGDIQIWADSARREAVALGDLVRALQEEVREKGLYIESLKAKLAEEGGSFRLGEPAYYTREDGTLGVAQPAEPAEYRPIQEVAKTK